MRLPTASRPVSAETSSSNSPARPPFLTPSLGPTTLSLMGPPSQSTVRTSPPLRPLGSPWLFLACPITHLWPERQRGLSPLEVLPPTLSCSTAPGFSHQRAACSTYSNAPVPSRN